MGYSINVPYYNSFWLKSVKDAAYAPNASQWPGLPWFTGSSVYPNTSYPVYPFGTATGSGASSAGAFNSTYASVDRMWHIEESRIKGGFNNTSVDLGVRAYLVDDNKIGSYRGNYLIYSGIYNSKTNFNETNVFSIGEPINRALNPAWGSIQKLYAAETNLLVFQELKTSKILVNKNAMYNNPEGSMNNSRVLGQVDPFVGRYGIGTNPESFAVHANRKYFVDKNKGVVLRLSNDGHTEISNYGMRDFFRDSLNLLSDNWISQNILNNAGETKIDIELSIPSDSIEIKLLNIDCCLVNPGSLVFIEETANPNIPVPLINTSTNEQYTIESIDCTTGAIILSGSGINDLSYISPMPVETSPGVFTWSGIYLENIYKSRLYGGYDIHNSNYTLSLQFNSAISADSSTVESENNILNGTNNTYKTLCFDESVKGWVSFYSFKPTWIDSLRNKFISTYRSKIYYHYDNTITNNRGKFYNASTPAEANITFLFNTNPNINKNFNTISYEGSAGWQVTSIKSEFEGMDYLNNSWKQSQDTIKTINSYLEGKYELYNPSNTGLNALTAPFAYAGFYRKENRYVANLVNNSTSRPNEIIFGNKMSGVKGFFIETKFALDNITEVGGPKELFSVGTTFVQSS